MSIINTSSPISSPYPSSLGNKHASKSSSEQTSGSSIIDQFLAYQHLSPQQKIRQAILEKLGMTEDGLKSLSPEARKKVEDEIKQEIEKQVKSNLAQKGILVDITV